MKYRQIAATLLFLAATSGVFAQGAGNNHKFYIGLDVGQSKLDNTNSFAGASHLDDTSTAYTVSLGYRFSRFFALEAGYSDQGDFSATIDPFCSVPGPGCNPIHEKTSMSGVLVNAIGIWPITEHFELNASLGVIFRDLKASSGTDAGGSTHWSQSDTVSKYGLGIGVPINEHFAIGLDVSDYREIGLGLDMGGDTVIVDEGDTLVTTLGMRWRF